MRCVYGVKEEEAGADTGWGLGVLGEESQGGIEGQGRGQAAVQRGPAARPGTEEGGHDGLGTFPGPRVRPASRLGARWTHSSRGHQPDSPRGRLRRQTAMHRALPPAPAPQPACAIARPPARGLPRAISRFQGGRTSLSLPARPPPGPRNPDDQRGATLQPAPLRRGGPPAYPGSRAPEPRPPSVLRRASELRPALLTVGRRVTRPGQPRRPGKGVMTSRRQVEAAVAIATGKSLRRGLLRRKPLQVSLSGYCKGR